MNSRFGAFQCKKHGHLDEKKDFLYGNLRSSVGCLDGVLSIQSSFERLQGRPKSLITWSQKMEPHFDGRDWVVWNPDFKKYRIHLSQPNGGAGFLPLPPGKYVGKIRQMTQQCPLKSPSVFPHCLEDFLSIQAAAKPRDRLSGAVLNVEPIGVSMGVPV